MDTEHSQDLPTVPARVPLPMDLGGRPAHWHAYAAAGVPLAPAAGIGSDLAQLGELAPLLGVGLAGAAVVAAVRSAGVGGERRRRRGRSLPLRWRVRLRLRPGPGFASRGELYRYYGRWPARKVAKFGRKSLTWRDRWLGPWQEYAVFHGRAQGILHRWGVYSTLEDITLVIAPPQEGKSQHAAAMIVRAPGPVAVTSIRGDLIRDTAGLRQQRGNVWIFNPENVGQYAGNMKWNPIPGCEDFHAAVRRAGHLVAASEARGLSDSSFWEDQGVMTLAALMHAAALMGGNMRHVFTWVMDPRESEHAYYVLTEHRGAFPHAAQTLRYLREFMPEKTREGVMSTLGRVLRFMLVPEIVETLTPAAGPGFDMEGFLRSTDTVYLVSGTDDSASPTAPLFCAFLAELAATSNRIGTKYTTADGQVVSRLDPPLTIVGDELGNTAPIPVDEWASWAAGSGILIIAYFQTWARIQERWGHHGAVALWGSSKMKIIGAGVTEPEVLAQMSRLIGRIDVREDEVHTDRWGNERRRQRWSEVDIIPPAEIRRIPRGKALVLRSTAPAPTIVTLVALRKTREYKRWLKAGAPVEGLYPVQQRQAPAPRPELATWGAVPVQPTEDEIAARRARRQPSQAAPAAPPGPPPLKLPPRPQPAPEQQSPPDTGQQGSDSGQPPSGWSPWQRRTGGSA